MAEEHQEDTTAYVVYLLKCADESLYTGITNQLEHRLKMHGQGKASKYTRSRLPVTLVHVERGYSKSEALSREKNIKNLPRKKKLLLLQNGADC